VLVHQFDNLAANNRRTNVVAGLGCRPHVTITEELSDKATYQQLIKIYGKIRTSQKCDRNSIDVRNCSEDTPLL
jgi:hypothetical protein